MRGQGSTPWAPVRASPCPRLPDRGGRTATARSTPSSSGWGTGRKTAARTHTHPSGRSRVPPGAATGKAGRSIRTHRFRLGLDTQIRGVALRYPVDRDRYLRDLADILVKHQVTLQVVAQEHWRA